MKKKISGLTLLELIIAVSLLGVLVIGFTGIQIFSNTHVVYTDRRAKVQNAVSLVLEHMTRNIKGTNLRGGAIGDNTNPLGGSLPVTITPITLNGNIYNAILIWVDWNNNGVRDAGDKQIAYFFNNNDICFIPNYTDFPNTSEAITTGGMIMGDFNSTPGTDTSYVTYDPVNSNNCIYVQITGRWDPSKAAYMDNPQIKMYTRINMPSVSTK